MSSYASLMDLAQFGAPAAAFASLSTTAQQAALDAASETADGYLRAKFKLPITTKSVDLVRAVCQIATYDLLSVRGFNPEGDTDANVRSRYLDAIHWLEGVAKGSITPPLTDSSPGGTLGGPFVLQSQLSDSSSVNGGSIVVAGSPRARGW